MQCNLVASTCNTRNSPGAPPILNPYVITGRPIWKMLHSHAFRHIQIYIYNINISTSNLNDINFSEQFSAALFRLIYSILFQCHYHHHLHGLVMMMMCDYGDAPFTDRFRRSIVSAGNIYICLASQQEDQSLLINHFALLCQIYSIAKSLAR